MGIVADENKTQESPNFSPSSSAKRLPLADKLKVYDLALPSEKQALLSELKAGRKAYISSHRPSQRVSDPTWAKLQAVFGN